MKISPIEIRKKEFEKAFRGYEKEEVDAFLQSLSQEWEKVQEENREHQRKIEFLEKEVSRMREVEATLFRTLKTAEDTSSNIIEQSNKAAELHIREAQMNAEGLLNEARSKARAMIEDAEIEVKNILDDLQIEAKNIEKEYNYIDSQKEYLLDEIKNYVKDTLDKVLKSEQKTSRTSFDLKLKEIRNINNHNPIKNLEITNTEVLLKPSEPATNVNVSRSTEEIKETKKEGGSFFDTIG
ncbi:MAG TPA: DivIVA domain-containing protein [Cytophagaceae bacterium]|jgi:cell division initiation protein|nr:DivIVA domain-containing protein [Cytophagaceae bacterium]